MDLGPMIDDFGGRLENTAISEEMTIESIYRVPLAILHVRNLIKHTSLPK